MIRRRLALAGPGVLHRAAVTNDEDLFTCEGKTRQDPMSYFAFEENGKVWWFDARSLWNWMARSVEPVNPYTKTLIPVEAKRRLRAIQRLSRFPYATSNADDMMTYRWNTLIQIFRDNGFPDIHPHQFAEFEDTEYVTMFILLERDLQIVLPERDVYRQRLLRLCRRGSEGMDVPLYRLHSATLLLRMLAIPRDPYVMVFSILSAFYRC